MNDKRRRKYLIQTSNVDADRREQLGTTNMRSVAAWCPSAIRPTSIYIFWQYFHISWTVCSPVDVLRFADGAFRRFSLCFVRISLVFERLLPSFAVFWITEQTAYSIRNGVEGVAMVGPTELAHIFIIFSGHCPESSRCHPVIGWRGYHPSRSTKTSLQLRDCDTPAQYAAIIFLLPITLLVLVEQSVRRVCVCLSVCPE